MPNKPAIPDLPHGLGLIAEAASVKAALKIALARGGSRLEIPQKAEGSLLASIVGLDAARKITEELKGERFEIPLAKRILSTWLQRDHQWSQERRAMALKVSRRTIQYWDAGGAPNNRQSDLFNPAA